MADMSSAILNGIIFGDSISLTKLWTNSKPAILMPDTTVTLSSSIQNFNGVLVVFNESTSSSTKFYSMTFNKSTSSNLAYYHGISCGLSNNYEFCRGWRIASNTTIYFTDATRVNATGNNNAVAIPVAIYGVTGQLNI